jgi:uncharacterized protein YjbI with pentapeptide repeats
VIGRRDATRDERVFDFSDVILAHAILDGAKLTGSLSRRIQLGPEDEKVRAWFGGADFTGATMRKANLTNALVTGAQFDDATLNGADFTGAIWKATEAVPKPPTGWVAASGRLKRANSGPGPITT